MKKVLPLLVLAILLGGFFLRGQQATPQQIEEQPAPRRETLVMGMPPWSTSPPPTFIVQTVLEDRLGYQVDVSEANIGVIFQGLSTGDIDILVDAWLPTLHAEYMESFGDNIDVLGTIYTGAELGWAVPTYVTPNSVEELNDYRDEFNGRVIGIDAGAGMMSVSQDIIDQYDLDFELVEGSEWAMLTALRDAYNNQEWIVVIAWRPHWKFAEFDLKFLEEPKGLWTQDEVKSLAHENLKEEAPDAATFLRNWSLPIEDLETMIYATEIEEREPQELAREWVEENSEQIDQWLENGS